MKDGRPVVVFVDDEQAVLSSLTRALQGEPYHLLWTRRPEQALEWVMNHPIHILVADQRMPGMTGTELLKSTLVLSPDTKRVMLTAYADAQLLAAASSDAKVDHFLEKPWDENRLKQIIRSLLPASVKPGESGDLLPRDRPSSIPVNDAGRLTLRMSCSGRTAGEVMDQIESARAGLLKSQDEIQIVLEDLMSLDDSVLGLLTQLVRAIFRSGSRVSLSLDLKKSHFGI